LQNFQIFFEISNFFQISNVFQIFTFFHIYKYSKLPYFPNIQIYNFSRQDFQILSKFIMSKFKLSIFNFNLQITIEIQALRACRCSIPVFIWIFFTFVAPTVAFLGLGIFRYMFQNFVLEILFYLASLKLSQGVTNLEHSLKYKVVVCMHKHQIKS